MPLLPLAIRTGLTLGDPAVPPNPDPNLDYYAIECTAEVAGKVRQQRPVGTKKVDGIDYTLEIINNVLYFSTPKPIIPPTDDMEGGAGAAFVNTNYDWLTYETVLNKPVFRKTNQSRKVGLYLVDTADLKLWIRDEMPPESLKAFCTAIFPDHTPDELKEISGRSWWWKLQPDLAKFAGQQAPYRKQMGAEAPPEESFPAVAPESAAAAKGSRSGLRLHLPRYAVLPYNYWDNIEKSRALGTDPAGEAHEIALLQLKIEETDDDCWDMWRTASRSAVMLLKKVKDPGVLWNPLPWKPWKFNLGVTDRAKYKNTKTGKFPERYQNDLFKAEVQGTGIFKLPGRTSFHFSVKTGVNFVGFEDQPGKDAMGDAGEWLVGCLRSDIIKSMQKLMVGKGTIPTDLLVQTEIAMIMERHASPFMEKEQKGEDGVAFRDLTVLETDRFYLAPLSIPFIGMDMHTLSEEFAHIDDAEWRAFWQKNWAEALGQAKGWFLMRYGMQHANPNVQNYLIEFPRMDTIRNLKDVKARIVIRDVADALVARQVIWALFGEDKACPAGDHDFTALTTAGLPALRYNFRNVATGEKSETGSTDEMFAKHGVHLLWQRFSTFYAANKEGGTQGDKLEQCPPARLAKVLRLLAQWLVIHAVVYVRTVEKALGFEFGKIEWHKLIAKPALDVRFPEGKFRGKYKTSAQEDLDWEDSAGEIITAYLGDAGRQKICDYHNRGWVDAAPAFTVRLLNNSAGPMPIQLVYFKSKDALMEGQRMSDPAGDIPFYAKTASDFDFEWWYRDPDQLPAGDALIKEKLTLTGLNLTPPLPVPTTAVLADPGPLSGSAMKVSAAVTMGTRKTLANVSFHFNGGALGPPLTASPFEAVLDTTKLKNGTYPLKVTVKDTLSAETTDGKHVTVANQLPVVTIDTAATDVSVATPNVAGSATAGAHMALQNITISLDNKLVDTVTGPAFDVALPQTDLTVGAHTVTVKATDTAGNESVEAELHFDIA